MLPHGGNSLCPSRKEVTLMEVLNPTSLPLFLLLVVPGLVSIKVWGLVVASDQRLADRLLEAASYGALNLAVSYPVIRAVERLSVPVWFEAFVILLLLPVLWPLIVNKTLKSGVFRGHIVDPVPTAWDDMFRRGETFFALIHLKNGKVVAGLYNGPNSYASSYPFGQDLYLSEAWQVEENGCPAEKVKWTKGLWITKDAFDYIEFFDAKGDEKSRE
jgi:hypothetical protein